jgi:hypothetical protein
MKSKMPADVPTMCARCVDGMRCSQPAMAIVFVPDYEGLLGIHVR